MPKVHRGEEVRDPKMPVFIARDTIPFDRIFIHEWLLLSPPLIFDAKIISDLARSDQNLVAYRRPEVRPAPLFHYPKIGN